MYIFMPKVSIVAWNPIHCLRIL